MPVVMREVRGGGGIYGRRGAGECRGRLRWRFLWRTNGCELAPMQRVSTDCLLGTDQDGQDPEIYGLSR